MKVYFERLKFLFKDPSGFFKSIEKEKSYWSILKFYVVLAVTVQVASLIINIPTFLSDGRIFALMGGGIIGNVISAFISPFIAAGIFHLGVLLFKGKGGYLNTFKPTTYSMALLAGYSFVSVIIVGIINWFSPPNLDAIIQGGTTLGYSLPATVIASLISVIGMIHFIVVLVRGLGTFQGLSVGKALVSIFVIPFVIFLILVLIFGSLIGAWVGSLGF